MITVPARLIGRFRTAIQLDQRLGATSANVQRCSMHEAIFVQAYGSSSFSPLRRVSEVPPSVSNRLQSLSQWILPCADGGWFIGRFHPVLLLQETTRPQPMESERDEDL
jgi:hypothetical protein